MWFLKGPASSWHKELHPQLQRKSETQAVNRAAGCRTSHNHVRQPCRPQLRFRSQPVPLGMACGWASCRSPNLKSARADSSMMNDVVFRTLLKSCCVSRMEGREIRPSPPATAGMSAPLPPGHSHAHAAPACSMLSSVCIEEQCTGWQQPRCSWHKTQGQVSQQAKTKCQRMWVQHPGRDDRSAP